MYPAEPQSLVESTPKSRRQQGAKTVGVPLAIGAAVATAALAGALFVGSSLAQQPTAVAAEPPTRGIGSIPIEAKLTGLQLPTLEFEE